MSPITQMNCAAANQAEDPFSFVAAVPFWTVLYSHLEKKCVYIGKEYQKALIITGQFSLNNLFQP